MPSRKTNRKEQITAQAKVKTPLGLALLAFSEKGLTRLAIVGDKAPSQSVAVGHIPETQSPPVEVLQKWRDRVAQALEDYFEGKPGSFDALPLDLQGSPFHLRVWQELRRIPSGATVSYQELARRLGNPKAARAVGQACGANPIPLIVPCHRVIAADGSLGGFSSGLPRKRWLLAHEGIKVEKGPGT